MGLIIINADLAILLVIYIIIYVVIIIGNFKILLFLK